VHEAVAARVGRGGVGWGRKDGTTREGEREREGEKGREREREGEKGREREGRLEMSYAI
jgi:hypothetical protein